MTAPLTPAERAELRSEVAAHRRVKAWFVEEFRVDLLERLLGHIDLAERRGILLKELRDFARMEHGSDTSSPLVIRRIVGELDVLDAEAARER